MISRCGFLLPIVWLVRAFIQSPHPFRGFGPASTGELLAIYPTAFFVLWCYFPRQDLSNLFHPFASFLQFVREQPKRVVQNALL
jgi:hypothetical protein